MKCISPIPLKNEHGNVYYVPCGKCAWCKKRIRDEWVFRMKQEKKVNKFSRFLTLTYSDDMLHYEVNQETGETVPSVCKEHIQAFHKDLWNAGFKFRFLVSSEYGPKTQRPHYHGIYFSQERIPYLDYWPYGENCTDYPARESSMKYVLKYTLKGSKVPDGAQDNFRSMSRRPGIGSSFHYKGEPYILEAGGVKVVPGHYYRRNYLNSLDSKLRNAISQQSIEYLASGDPDKWLRAEYERTGTVMDFDSWKSQIYKNDYFKQCKINQK